MSKVFSRFYINLVDNITYSIKRFRVMPRGFLLGYSIMLYYMIAWIMGLEDLNTAQTILTSVLTTMATPLTKFYTENSEEPIERMIEKPFIIIKYIDFVSYAVDRFRIVPLMFVIHFIVSLVMLILWGIGLGEALTTSQATFISVYAGNASMVLGFYITTDSNNSSRIKSYRESLFKDYIEK